MLIRPRSAEFALSPCSTRLPFRFGMVTMTWAPLLYVRVEIESSGGERSVGYACDLLVPKWFEKNPRKSLEDDMRALMASAQTAAGAWLESEAGTATVFEHWLRIYAACMKPDEAQQGDGLVRGFGVALLERAMMDAVCRLSDCSFFQALERNRFGFEPERVHPELRAWRLEDSLPERAAETIAVRHTVGLLDALRDSELETRVDDGLPESLEADIRHYGLTHFKLKLCGDDATDLQRLLAIQEVFEDTVGERAVFTVDGNEQFERLQDLQRLFDRLEREESGRELLKGLLYIEQPLPRGLSFDHDRIAGIHDLSQRAPLILDEADYGLQAFPRGIELGYRGVSIKNCKGVFRALINRGLCERRGEGLFQSAEDLTNLPVHALQQDLATIAALGLEHVERNGHHYFLGLQHLPTDERDDALRMHADLYEEVDGIVRLKMEAGRLQLSSLQARAYGTELEPDLKRRLPLEGWEPATEVKA